VLHEQQQQQSEYVRFGSANGPKSTLSHAKYTPPAIYKTRYARDDDAQNNSNIQQREKIIRS
jgi:hypothetical protein